MIELIKILHPHPALLLIDNNEKHIVISDLHIGFEERFTKKGISIQSSTTNMQNVLRELIIKEKPNDVIILGDIKDSFVSVTKSERIEVPRFFREISKLSNIRVIPGNHDGNIKQLLPNNITVEDVYGINIDKTTLLHGHTNINESFRKSNRIIIGHLHTIYNQQSSPVTGYQLWSILKAKKEYLFKEEDGMIEIITLPSFNKELTSSGFSIHRKKNICPIIRKTRSENHVTSEHFILWVSTELIYMLQKKHQHMLQSLHFHLVIYLIKMVLQQQFQNGENLVTYQHQFKQRWEAIILILFWLRKMLNKKDLTKRFY